MNQTIAVLDFGSQYTQVIARRIRECNVYSKIYPFGTSAATLKADGVIGIILSGGPSSVFAKGAPMPDRAIFDLGVPVLGICYGIQLMGRLLGGTVARGERREYGNGTLRIQRPGRLFAKLPRQLTVWNSHGDKLTALPPGFVAIGTTLSVYPVANCIPRARDAGARVVIINGSETEMDHLADEVIRGDIEFIVPAMCGV